MGWLLGGFGFFALTLFRSEDDEAHADFRQADDAVELPRLFRHDELVFSMLDRIVTNQLTFSWGLTNILGAIVIWVFGVYIDLARHR